MRQRIRRFAGLPASWVPMGYGQPSVWVSIPLYVRTVFTRWSVIVGLVAGVIGYVADLFTGLIVPPILWASLFLIGFVVANVQMFHELRRLTPSESLGLPQWASGALNARGGGAHLVLILYGFPSRTPWTTNAVPQATEAVSQHFKLTGLIPRSRQNGVTLNHPDKPQVDGPLFDAWFGIEYSGAIRLEWRRPGTLHLGWVLIRIDDGLRFLLSDVRRLVIDPSKRHHVIVSLSDWPQEGVVVGGLIAASRPPDTFHGGGQERREYQVSRKTDNWAIAKDFASAILADSSYVGFEAGLGQLKLSDCESYRDDS